MSFGECAGCDTEKESQMKEFDIIVCGATGYTGQLACEHLARSYGSELRWAMAGRAMTKLRRNQARFEVPSPVQLIAVDITDAAATASLQDRAMTHHTTAGRSEDTSDRKK